MPTGTVSLPFAGVRTDQKSDMTLNFPIVFETSQMSEILFQNKLVWLYVLLDICLYASICENVCLRIGYTSYFTDVNLKKSVIRRALQRSRTTSVLRAELNPWLIDWYKMWDKMRDTMHCNILYDSRVGKHKTSHLEKTNYYPVITL